MDREARGSSAAVMEGRNDTHKRPIVTDSCFSGYQEGVEVALGWVALRCAFSLFAIPTVLGCSRLGQEGLSYVFLEEVEGWPSALDRHFLDST
jgi:hypothetical protein